MNRTFKESIKTWHLLSYSSLQFMVTSHSIYVFIFYICISIYCIYFYDFYVILSANWLAVIIHMTLYLYFKLTLWNELYRPIVFILKWKKQQQKTNYYNEKKNSTRPMLDTAKKVLNWLILFEWYLICDDIWS